VGVVRTREGYALDRFDAGITNGELTSEAARPLQGQVRLAWPASFSQAMTSAAD